MRTRVLIVAVILATFASLSIAQTPDRLPPGEDNACFPGGSMDGRCENELHWNAGWYLAHVEAGLIRPQDVPSQFTWAVASLLPAPVVSNNTSGGGGGGDNLPEGVLCFHKTDNSASLTMFASNFDFKDAFRLRPHRDCNPNAPWDSTLSAGFGGFNAILNEASILSAQAKCKAIREVEGSSSPTPNESQLRTLASVGYNAPANIYLCTIN